MLHLIYFSKYCSYNKFNSLLDTLQDFRQNNFDSFPPKILPLMQQKPAFFSTFRAISSNSWQLLSPIFPSSPALILTFSHCDFEQFKISLTSSSFVATPVT